MSNSLETNYLFIGHHLTVNEFCHEQNLNFEKWLVLIWPEKKIDMVFKKSALIEIDFFYSELPQDKNYIFYNFSSVRNTRLSHL